MNSQGERSAGFRPEIQALRAVAVVLVLCFHLWPSAVTGGYVGVDVFFVISGFLITSQLAGEVARTGRLSLRRFWARRIRRLLPAASLVLAVAFLLMFAVVPMPLWQRSGMEIAASAFSIQNWVLGASAVDYLGAEGTGSIVQHYWSLSVEEQFYIVWPLLMVLALLVTRRRNRRSTLFLLLALVFTASLLFSIVETARSQPAAYFHTGARAWEFAAGGLLALAPPSWGTWLRSRRRSGLLRTWAGWIGLALILLAAVSFNGATAFPGAIAVIPVLGTVLVIAAGSQRSSWSASRLLAIAPVQVVGDLSYGIYLWHWPLVVVLPDLLGAPMALGGKLLIIAFSVALAWLMRRYLEDPVRRAPALIARPGRAYGLAAAVAVLFFVASTVNSVSVQAGIALAAEESAEQASSDPCYGAAAIMLNCPAPFAVPPDLNTAFAEVDKGSLGENCNSDGTAVKECSFGDLESPRHTLAVVGNSHAGHLVAALDSYGRAHSWKVVLMRKTGCTGALAHPVAEPTDHACTEWTDQVLNELESRADIDIVVYASNNDSLHYLGPPGLDKTGRAALVAGISDTLGSLVAEGKTVVVVGDVPGHYSEPVPECVYLHRSEYDPCATSLSDGREKDNFVAAAARETPGVGYVDLLPYFCDRLSCHVVIGGTVAYIDEHHLSAAFSRSLGPYLGAAIAARLPAP